MDVGNEVVQRLKTLAGNWTANAAVGSFVLYVLGYLAVRFHVTVLGIGTDLAVLDERYLFAGAKFLVFLGSEVPKAVLLVLPLVVVVSVLRRVVLATIPATLARSLANSVPQRWQRMKAWGAAPTRAALGGVIVSVLMIQLVMNRCYLFSNLLVADTLPEPRWLHPLLLGRTTEWAALYFPGLVVGTAVAAALLWLGAAQRAHTTGSRLLTTLLGFLITIQCLLLPVNYGVLFLDKTMPRVATLGDGRALESGQQAWLVWEGKEGVTYLVRDRRTGPASRRLVTLPRKDVTRTEIMGYNQIFRVLFDP